MPPSPSLRVSEGYTNSLVLPAVSAILSGVVLCVFFLIPGLVLLAFGLSLFTTTTGFELDATQRRFRSYKRWCGMSWGIWKSLHEADHIELWLSSESHTYRTAYNMYIPQTANATVKSVTYDLIVCTGNSHRTIAFEFLSYKKALTAARLLHEHLQLPFRDRVAEKLAENRERRQRR